MWNYTKPRLEATIENWPYGRHRVTAFFTIEKGKRGERAVRVTENPKRGGLNKPKKLTYALKSRIVEGDDGRVYILSLSHFGQITVFESNFKYERETIHQDNARYPDLLKLFNA